MSNIFKTVYENCECTYTCGLSLRKFLRVLSVIGMISSIIYITVGTCIIVHIVQTEKVEWFPNMYYRIPEANGPVASRIVLPPPSSNGFEDFEIYRPKQNQYQPGIAFQPQPNTIFPVNDDSNVRLGEQQEKAIYYRRNVGLFLCLAATLIVINFIQLVTDISLFYSTLKGKRTTSFWVYFLLNIILWIMTLICFITIFSGGGLFLLLVFLSGTAIRVYTVYALHELMSDLRKPRASNEEGLGDAKEIKPEPRTVLDAEEGNNETADADEAITTATANADESQPAANADEGESTSSTKSLQPAQDEDELENNADLVMAENQELQCSEMDKTDNEADNDDGENEQAEAEPSVLDEDPDEVDEVPEIMNSDELEDANEEQVDDDPAEVNCDDTNDEEPDTTVEASNEPAEEELDTQGQNDGENDENIGNEDNENDVEGDTENSPQSEEVEMEDNVQEDELEQNEQAENDEPGEPEEDQVDLAEDGEENAIVVDNDEPEPENVPDEEENGVPEENAEPESGEQENASQEDEGEGDGDELKEASQSADNESPETDSPIESGENEEQNPGQDEDADNGEEAKEASDMQKKRKRSKRKRRTKKA